MIELDQTVSMKLDHADSIKTLFQVRDRYGMALADFHKLQKYIMDRITALSLIAQRQQQQVVDIQSQQVKMKVENERLSETTRTRLEMHNNLETRLDTIYEYISLTLDRLSIAEVKFGQEVVDCCQRLITQKDKLEELTRKAAQVMALQLHQQKKDQTSLSQEALNRIYPILHKQTDMLAICKKLIGNLQATLSSIEASAIISSSLEQLGLNLSTDVSKTHTAEIPYTEYTPSQP